MAKGSGSPVNFLLALVVIGGGVGAFLFYEQGMLAMQYSEPMTVDLETVANGDHPPGAYVTFSASRDPRRKNHVVDTGNEAMRYLPLLPADDELQNRLNAINKAENDYVVALQNIATKELSRSNPGPVFNELEELEGKANGARDRLTKSVIEAWGRATVPVYEAIPDEDKDRAKFEADEARPWLVDGIEFGDDVEWPVRPEYPELDITFDADDPASMKRAARGLVTYNQTFTGYYATVADQVKNELESFDAPPFFIQGEEFTGVVRVLPDAVGTYLAETAKAPVKPVFYLEAGATPDMSAMYIFFAAAAVALLGLLALIARLMGSRRANKWADFDDDE